MTSLFWNVSVYFSSFSVFINQASGFCNQWSSVLCIRAEINGEREQIASRITTWQACRHWTIMPSLNYRDSFIILYIIFFGNSLFSLSRLMMFTNNKSFGKQFLKALPYDYRQSKHVFWLMRMLMPAVDWSASTRAENSELKSEAYHIGVNWPPVVSFEQPQSWQSSC